MAPLSFSDRITLAMKPRSAYGWLYVISGSIWAVGMAGITTGIILYPKSNLLGGFGLVFGPVAWFGGGVFQITLVVWLIHKLIGRFVMRKAAAKEPLQARTNETADPPLKPMPVDDSAAHG